MCTQFVLIKDKYQTNKLTSCSFGASEASDGVASLL